MMSVSRNRVIGSVLKSRIHAKKLHVDSTHGVHSTTDSSKSVALSSAYRSGSVLQALRVSHTLPKNNEFVVPFHRSNEFKDKVDLVTESESLISARLSHDPCNTEHDYVLLHAFQTLVISSVHLPACDKNRLNSMGLPTTQSGKNVQITVPSISQHEVLDPTIAGIPIANIEEPATPTNVEKQAARLIVIRRRKMKKHKLRKLRKRMKFVFEKIRNRREKRKETAFQAELLAQMKAAEDFDAEKWAQDYLNRSRTYAKQRAEAEFWNSEEGGRLRYEIYINTRKIPPDQR